MNLRNRDEMLPNLLILAALVLLFLSLLVMVFVPRPTTAGLARGKERSRKQLESEIEKAKTRSAQIRAELPRRLWSESPETVTALVLAQLTTEANKRNVQVGAFRPQKGQTFPDLLELPFSLQVIGDYPNVLAFLRTLDTTDSKIALRSVQIASSDAASSAVTATLNVVVYARGRQQQKTSKQQVAGTPKQRPNTQYPISRETGDSLRDSPSERPNTSQATVAQYRHREVACG